MDHVEITDLEEWRAWLEQHHDRSLGAWLITFRKGRGPYVGTYRANNEALRYGWFDQHQSPVDDIRVKHLYRPRRPFLPWSRSDRFETEKLIDSGRIHATGLRRAYLARSDGSWIADDAARTSQSPLDLMDALDRETNLRDKFDLLAPGLKNLILRQLATGSRSRNIPRPQLIEEILDTLNRLPAARPWWTASPEPEEDFFPLSISKHCFAMFETVHRTAGTVAIYGPPGLGKSRSAREFIRQNDNAVAPVRLPAGHRISWLDTQRAILAAVRDLGATRSHFGRGETAKEVQALLAFAISDLSTCAGGTWRGPSARVSQITVVVDDAQRLSQPALQGLLQRNGPIGIGSCPVGLVLLGTPVLRSRVIAAVEWPRSRHHTMPIEVVELGVDDLSPADMRLFLRRAGLPDEAQKGVVRYLRSSALWSLRKAADLVLDYKIDPTDWQQHPHGR